MPGGCNTEGTVK